MAHRTVTRNCEYCQEPFQARIKSTPNRGRFCSHSCSSLALAARHTIKDRLLRHITTAPSGCWIWSAGIDHDGYAVFTIKGQSFRASRVAHEHFIAPFPKEKLVLHRCDNPSCVNPDHLFLGSNDDNMRDMAVKNRAHHKLTIEQVQAIRNDPRSCNKIAKDYGITGVHVWHIKKRQRRYHIS